MVQMGWVSDKQGGLAGDRQDRVVEVGLVCDETPGAQEVIPVLIFSVRENGGNRSVVVGR